MLISHWMTKDVITVTPETSMMKASKLLKTHSIRRLPVVDEAGCILGIVSDRDIKEASPSKATTLDIHELYYLLAEIKVRDIMTRDPVSLHPGDTVEHAAMLMIEKNFGGLPVVDDDSKVVGIMTYSDVFKVLITITGIRYGGVQFAFELPNRPDGLDAVLEDITGHNVRIASILTFFPDENSEMRRVYIRILPTDREAENAVVDDIKSKYNLIYWARDTKPQH
jgi:acetoin utilization protein AcuB